MRYEAGTCATHLALAPWQCGQGLVSVCWPCVPCARLTLPTPLPLLPSTFPAAQLYAALLH